MNTAEIRNRWYSGELVPGIVFTPNAAVVVPPGQVSDDIAAIVSLETVEPEVTYLVERSGGSDEIVEQSKLLLLIYVAMLDEGTKVWRPVAAKPITEKTARIITDRPDDESWEFQPGEVVGLGEETFEGHRSLVALSRGRSDA